MAAMVGQPMGGDLDSMLGHLENGAMFNIAGKVDHEGLKTTYGGLMELMGKMVPGGLSEADLEQLRALITKGVDSMGDSLAITFGVDGETTPPFAGKYVIEVKDRAAFEQVLEEELKLMEEGGVIADIYKGFGMEMDVEIDRDAGTYKGVQIGGAKLGFKVGDEDAMEKQAKMFEMIFGDGIDYRWAFEKDNCVYTLGSDANGTIRELIDQVRAGGPRQVGSEMKAALEAVDNSDKADVVGTVNLVRYMSMVASFVVAAEGVALPQVETPTESNLAFAGRTTEAGNLEFQIVMPKGHLTELKSMFENVFPKIEEQKRLQREKQKEQARANNI
jgi:hypothetical protein